MADNRQGTSFTRLDAPPADPASPSSVNFAYVTEGFFEALDISLIEGRTFAGHDDRDGRRVVLIDQKLAQQAFGRETALGRMVTIGVSTQAPFEVVGVVGNDHHLGVDTEPTATFFIPYRQVPAMGELALLTRVAGDQAVIANALRRLIRGIDSEMPFYQVRTLEQVVEASVATPRSLAWLLSGFAAFRVAPRRHWRFRRPQSRREPAHAGNRRPARNRGESRSSADDGSA